MGMGEEKNNNTSKRCLLYSTFNGQPTEKRIWLVIGPRTKSRRNKLSYKKQKPSRIKTLEKRIITEFSTQEDNRNWKWREKKVLKRKHSAGK